MEQVAKNGQSESLLPTQMGHYDQVIGMGTRVANSNEDSKTSRDRPGQVIAREPATCFEEDD